MLTATGQAIHVPAAIIPEVYEDEELVLILRNWYAGAMVTADGPFAMVSAIIAHFQWFPIRIPFLHGKLDLFTTPGGQDWIQVIAQDMPSICAVHTIEACHNFSNDCGFQCVGWVLNLVFDPHHGDTPGRAVEPSTTIAWRGLFEHHLHVTGKALESVIPAQIAFGGSMEVKS